jgi:hypothetical protein
MNPIPRQPDLFDEPRLDGLFQASAIVTPGEEQMLIASIDAVELSPFRFHGWLGKRLTVSYGWNYDFEDASFTPGEAIPDWLLPVRAKAAEFAGLDPVELVQSLLIRYDRVPGLAGTETGRCTGMSSASRSVLRQRCGSGAASPVASIGHRFFSHPDRSIT